MPQNKAEALEALLYAEENPNELRRGIRRATRRGALEGGVEAALVLHIARRNALPCPPGYATWAEYAEKSALYEEMKGGELLAAKVAAVTRGRHDFLLGRLRQANPYPGPALASYWEEGYDAAAAATAAALFE